MQKHAKSPKTSVNKNYAEIFDNILEGVQIIDFEYRYYYVNSAVVKQGKSTKAELIGKKMTEKYPGIENTEVFKRIQNCMQKRELQQMENFFTFPDGSSGWFELRMEPIPEGVFILSLDITSAKEAELQRKELDQLKNVFIQTVSHQLRSPLGVIRWNLERLLKGESLSAPSMQEMLKTSLEANLQVINKINDLVLAMDIARGDIRINKSNISLTDQLEAVLTDFKHRFAEKRFEFKTEYSDAERLIVNADPLLIKDVMIKLIENSLIYTPPGGEIIVRLTKNAGNARFEVQDNGIGIPKKEQESVFNRFFRASNAVLADTESSGLSLYVARHFIVRHAGKIGFKSEEGKGSTFWFELPLVD